MIFFEGVISYNTHKLRRSASKTLIKEFSPYENSLQVCSKQYIVVVFHYIFSFSVIGPTNRYPFYSLYHSHLFLYGLELSYGILWQFGTFH